MDNAERALVDVIKGRGSIGALLGISADDVEQLVQLGRGHLVAGRHDDAQRVFDGLCALEPEVAALHQLRGVALDHRKRFAEAAEAYTRAIHLVSADDSEARAIAYASRGIARMMDGDAIAAFADLALARPSLGAAAGPLTDEVDRLLASSAAAMAAEADGGT